jgi:hypothetical protein
MPPSQQQQIDALRAEIKALAERQAIADAMRADTHQMVIAMSEKVDHLCRVFLEPQVGQGPKTLAERMAEVTVSIESGGRVMRLLVLVAAALTALAAIMKFGIIKG